MNRLLSSLTAFAFVASLGSGVAFAKHCRDSHGKFMKCPTTMGSTMHKPCRDKHGKFTKCAK